MRAPEADLNAFAYASIEDGNATDAAALLEFALREFPGSSNLHDSLGGAYRRAGNRAEAIRHYRRSLELDPENGNARKMLEQLEGGR